MEQAPNRHRSPGNSTRRGRFPLSGKARWTLPYVITFALIAAAVAAVPLAQRADAETTVDIGQTTIGNVFDEGQTPTFEVKSSESEVSWTVHDYWGTKVGSGTAQVTDGTAQLRTSPESVGYYELEVTAGEGDTAESAETRYTVMPPVRQSQADNFVYGVQTHFAHGWSRDLVSLLDKLGVESTRDAQQWQTIETAKGEYDFGVSDGRFQKYMVELKDHGIDPLMQFGIYNDHYDNGATPHTDEAQQAYGDFIEAVRGHYGDQIQNVGVYNEPNQPKFGDHGDGPADAEPDNYMKLLQNTEGSIDDELTVSGPELAAGATRHDAWFPWLQKFFELGGLDHLDAVSMHPYRDRCCPPEYKFQEDLADVEGLMRQYGGEDKPIWITEQGWSSNLVTPETQAAYVPRAYALSMAYGVERFHWNALMDVENGSYGLLRWGKSPYGSYVPKPAYLSYAVMVNQLSGKAFEGTDDTPPGVMSQRMGKGDQTTHVMWAPDGPRDVELSTRHPVQVTDLMGKTRTLEPVNGVVALGLTEEPMYVQGTVDGIEKARPYSITAHDASISDNVRATLQLDNSDGGQAKTATYSVLGENYELSAAAGEVDEQQIEIPPSDRVGRRVLTAEVEVGGKLTALTRSDIDVHEDVTMSVRPQVTNVEEEQTAMAVLLTNHSESTARTVNNIEWRVGGSSGTDQPNVTIEPGTSKLISIDLPDRLVFWKPYPASVTTQVDDLQELVYEGKTGFNPVSAATPNIDGNTSEFANLPSVNLGTYGTPVEVPDRPPYEGPDDLSGKLWMAADQENLYIAAKTTDQTFSGASEPANAWEADSIQLGLSSGLPGSSGEFYDYTFALDGNGDSIGYRNYAPAGEDVGTVDYPIAVQRNEDQNKTRYEVAIPWEDIQKLSPDDKVFSLSFLVNDNDGDDREGWIEWGSGIGQGKDPSLFNPVVRTN